VNLGIVLQAGGSSIGLRSQTLVPQSVNCKRPNKVLIHSLLHDPNFGGINVSPSSHVLGCGMLLLSIQETSSGTELNRTNGLSVVLKSLGLSPQLREGRILVFPY
jgi:hypothetical protein